MSARSTENENRGVELCFKSYHIRDIDCKFLPEWMNVLLCVSGFLECIVVDKLVQNKMFGKIQLSVTGRCLELLLEAKQLHAECCKNILFSE